MSSNSVFPYYLFGIYIIELGNFFKGKFTNFTLSGNPLIPPTVPPEKAITSQVFFGTPRAAFRNQIQKNNGIIKLPMINYWVTDYERKVEHERPSVWIMASPFDAEHPSMKRWMMRAPQMWKFTYTVNLWTNSERERDVMMYKLVTAFPQGRTSLIYFPDLANHPECYLEMPHSLELTYNDETEIEGLDMKEVRDKIKTSFTIICQHAFVPYEPFEVPVVEFINFQSIMNESLENGTYDETLIYNLKWYSSNVSSAIFNITAQDVSVNIS